MKQIGFLFLVASASTPYALKLEYISVIPAQSLWREESRIPSRRKVNSEGPNSYQASVRIELDMSAIQLKGGGVRPLTQLVSGEVGFSRKDWNTVCAHGDCAVTRCPIPGMMIVVEFDSVLAT